MLAPGSTEVCASWHQPPHDFKKVVAAAILIHCNRHCKSRNVHILVGQNISYACFIPTEDNNTDFKW